MDRRTHGGTNPLIEVFVAPKNDFLLVGTWLCVSANLFVVFNVSNVKLIFVSILIRCNQCIHAIRESILHQLCNPNGTMSTATIYPVPYACSESFQSLGGETTRWTHQCQSRVLRDRARYKNRNSNQTCGNAINSKFKSRAVVFACILPFSPHYHRYEGRIREG